MRIRLEECSARGANAAAACLETCRRAAPAPEKPRARAKKQRMRQRRWCAGGVRAASALGAPGKGVRGRT